MNLSLFLIAGSAFFYGLSFVLHLISFSGRNAHRVAFLLMRIAFLIGTFGLASEAITEGFFLPVSNLSQAMAFFAWSLAFVYLVLLVKSQSESFGLILSPVLFGLMAGAVTAKAHAGAPEAPLPTALLNPYFVVHIAGAFFAYASFTLSFAAGALYLIQHRELKSKHPGTFYHKLPSLEELERLIYQPLVWGAPLLAIAAGVGFIWSKSAYGEFWVWDPKTILTGVTVALYSGILYLRYAAALHGKRGALFSLFAFAVVLFSFLGARFIHGSHDYLK